MCVVVCSDKNLLKSRVNCLSRCVSIKEVRAGIRSRTTRRVHVCSHYSVGIDGSGWMLISLSARRANGQLDSRSAPAEPWPTRSKPGPEPGTLITALKLLAAGNPPLCCLLPPSREERLLLFSYASPCVVVVVSSSSFLCSVKRSVVRHAFAAGLTLPLLVRLPCSLSLRPRSLLLSAARARRPIPSHFLDLSLTIFRLLGCVFLHSLISISRASLRTRKYSSLFHLCVPLSAFVRLPQPSNLLTVSSALPPFHRLIFAYFTFPHLFHQSSLRNG
jgi:hypothetical protein